MAKEELLLDGRNVVYVLGKECRGYVDRLTRRAHEWRWSHDGRRRRKGKSVKPVHNRHDLGNVCGELEVASAHHRLLRLGVAHVGDVCAKQSGDLANRPLDGDSGTESRRSDRRTRALSPRKHVDNRGVWGCRHCVDLVHGEVVAVTGAGGVGAVQCDGLDRVNG